LSPPRILFIADAGPRVGGGHVMRSLTLAQALAARGAEVGFVASPDVQDLLDVFGPDIGRVPTSSTAPADLVHTASDTAFDAVVFDHYGLGKAEHVAIAAGRPSLAIDDLADRRLGVDLVLDPGPARRTADYDGLTGKAGLLLGPTYAPVRPEFAALREAALLRREGPVRRLLVALGLTDVGGITARVVARLLPLAPDLILDVVVGGHATSLPQLRVLAAQDPRLRIYVDSRDMAELTARADAAVGAAGSTTWERCVLGLPSILLVLADNQRPAAEALAASGAALVLDAADPAFEAGLDAAGRSLLDDEALRSRISAASAALCDGLGAPRAAEAFLALIAERHP
jgi:UDP-2,4-diacetamido-2,4,6-trideoxy-beta-L-altropyranose hydrolase